MSRISIWKLEINIQQKVTYDDLFIAFCKKLKIILVGFEPSASSSLSRILIVLMDRLAL